MTSPRRDFVIRVRAETAEAESQLNELAGSVESVGSESRGADSNIGGLSKGVNGLNLNLVKGFVGAGLLAGGLAFVGNEARKAFAETAAGSEALLAVGDGFNNLVRAGTDLLEVSETVEEFADSLDNLAAVLNNINDEGFTGTNLGGAGEAISGVLAPVTPSPTGDIGSPPVPGFLHPLVELGSDALLRTVGLDPDQGGAIEQGINTLPPFISNELNGDAGLSQFARDQPPQSFLSQIPGTVTNANNATSNINSVNNATSNVDNANSNAYRGGITVTNNFNGMVVDDSALDQRIRQIVEQSFRNPSTRPQIEGFE